MTRLPSTKFSDDVLTSMKDIITNKTQMEVSVGDGEKIIMLSEQEYRNMCETIYLSSNSELRESILDGMATPLEDCIPASEVKW